MPLSWTASPRVRLYFRTTIPSAPAFSPGRKALLTARSTSPVLLVEDRDSLRAVLRDTLKAEGYAVLEAADEFYRKQLGGTTAVQTCRREERRQQIRHQ